MADENVLDTSDKIHNHAEEVENSRPLSGLTQRSGSNLGPLRTGRGTPTDVGSTVAPSTQDSAQDLPRKSPLPPIGSENTEESVVSEESEVDINLGDERTEPKAEKVNRPERKRPPKVLNGYRSELLTPDPTEGEKMVIRDVDGRTKTLISMECQTEWSWMEDMKRFEGLNRTSVTHPALTSDNDADYSEEEEAQNSSAQEIPKVKGKESAKTKAASSTKEPTQKVTGTSQSGRSQHAPSVVQSVAPSLRDDDYGIPILQISTDSDSSDEETPSEIHNSDEHKEAQDTVGTLPSVGPPQILQYNRESEQKELDPGDPDNLDPDVVAKLVPQSPFAIKRSPTPPLSAGPKLPPFQKSGGIFQGTCEFCGDIIKRFPTMDEQKDEPPEKLYCCNEYRQFVQFMVSNPLHDKFNMDKKIDIKPHAPFGSKQARNAAKERAALSVRKINYKEKQIIVERIRAKMERKHRIKRMRERELARQQAAIGTLGGGPGGPNNFYQFARQMKTINYCLSSQRCLEEGWTIRPPTPLQEGDHETELFEPQPVLPPWADPQQYFQQYHRGCTHKYKPHFHNVFFEPGEATPTQKNNGLIRKFYPNGSKFVILFPDGTGNVFYPSGRVAVSIVALEEKGLYTYLVTEDLESKAKVQALFQNTGCGTSYYPKGDIRVCLDQLGGVELDAHGAKKRKWNWKEQAQHVHAPPIQPLTLAVNPQVAVRIMSQENISLTFTANQRSVRFQVGAHLKLRSPEHLAEPEIDDDQLFRDEVKNRIQELLLKVNNLLKFPKSPKLDKLPNPLHLTTKQNRTEKLRAIRREKTMAKEKKSPTPVVIVN